MNWLKVGAVVVGGIVVFFVVNSVIHILFGLLSAIAFVALVAGGVYAVSKVVGSRRKNPELRQRTEYHESEPPRYHAPRPEPSRPAPADVDDELARLKREMGR